MKFPFARFSFLPALACLLWTFPSGCSRDLAPDQQEQVMENPEMELEPEPSFDCSFLAETYVPCLPLDSVLKEDADYEPPLAWVSFPCESGTRVDVFTVFSGPDDLALWKTILQDDDIREACFHIHLFSPDHSPPVIELLARLKSSPHEGWEILNAWFSEKKYLYPGDPALEGPPALPDPLLQEKITAHVKDVAHFGATSTLLLLNHRPVKELRIRKKPGASVSGQHRQFEKQLAWTPRQSHRHIMEFMLLCRTRMDWKHRMATISDCIEKTGSNGKSANCSDLLSCVRENLYHRDWNELETTELENPLPPFAVLGKGSSIQQAVIDPLDGSSGRMLKTLMALVDRHPELQVYLYLEPADQPGRTWVRILEATRESDGEQAALCLLMEGYRHTSVMEPPEMAHLSFRCGTAPVDLQNVPKHSRIPGLAVPAFSRNRHRPCLLLEQRLIEGAVSLDFLEYGLSRFVQDIRSR